MRSVRFQLEPAPARTFGSALLVTLLALAAGCDAFRSPEARVERAREALAAGDFRAASIELKSVLDSDPDNAEARLALAETSLALGDPETADKELRRGLAAGLPPARAAALQGRVMLATGEAAALLQKLNDRALPVQEPEWSVLKGDALVTLGDAAGAEPLYRAVHEAHPEHVRATVGLALAMAMQGREQAALDLLAGYLQAHPETAEAWLLRGEILSRTTRYSEATSAFEQATSDLGRRLDLPRQLSALAGLADAQIALGAADEARATLERMRSVAGDAMQTRLIAARLALIDQDYAAAVTQLQPVVAAVPDFAPARFLLGAALLMQGNLEQAESHLSQVVRLTPENVEARKLLAKARLRLQRYDAAVQVLTPAMQGEAFDPELSSLLSEAKLQAGAPAEAVAVLERTVRQSPENTGIKLDLAAAYIVAGRSTQAVEILRSLPEVVGDRRREALLVAALAAAKGPVEARHEVDALIARNPGDTVILSLGAGHALSQGDFTAAREYLDRALAVQPTDPRLLELLAETEVRAGSLDAAETVLQRLAEVPGSRSAARLGLVQIAQLRGRTADARKGLEQIRVEDPAATVPRLMLARMMLTAGEAAQASTVLSEVVAIAPRDAGLRLQVARLLGEFSRYDEAMRQAREAVEIAPEAADAWAELARMQLARDLPGPARQSAEKAVAIDRDSIEGVGLLALLDLREDRGEAALQRSQALVERRPADPRAMVLEGDVRLSLGQPREAAEAFSRALALRPDLQIAAKQSAALRSARMANPEAPLARWVAERPDDVRARALLAEAYQVGGRRDLAIKHYERLTASPTVGFAQLNNLAWLYYEQGDDRAEATARRAYDLASDNPAVIDTYGWILTEKGDLTRGLEALARAVQLAPEDPDMRYHYAAALARSGKRQSALDILDQVLGSKLDFASRAEAERLRDRLAAGGLSVVD
jgi:putative PEP-CTERM system TPR-repeat lipoprotein